MVTTAPPTDEKGVADVVRAANASGTALEIAGSGSRRGVGRPIQAAATLSLQDLAGITLYRPGELVLRAQAGTTVAEVEATVAEAGQRLPFEPPDWRHLLGTEGTAPTIGGLVAANLAGPARVARGALRDSLIGVRFVDGSGAVHRSGGRVMKNVTGLDLVKLQAGAHGTLGVLTEATFKVLPAAEDEATVLLAGLDLQAAGAAMRRAMASPFEVSGAAHLPAELAGASAPAGNRASATALRLEHFSEFLGNRTERLIAHVAAAVEARVLDAEASRRFWAEVRDVRPLALPRERAVWRVSTTPTAGPTLLADLASTLSAEGYLDAAGGTVWLAVGAEADAGAEAIRARLRAPGGHATLVRAPDAVRAAVEVFEPEPAPVQTMTKRLKSAFDPNRVLNPGRMYAGI